MIGGSSDRSIACSEGLALWDCRCVCVAVMLHRRKRQRQQQLPACLGRAAPLHPLGAAQVWSSLRLGKLSASLSLPLAFMSEIVTVRVAGTVI